MYLYTVKKDDLALLAVSQTQNGPLYPLSAYGLDFRDMNDLIDRIAPDQLARLKTAPDAPALEDYALLAPIPRPKQDVLCLGINYYDHAVESGRFHDGAFGGVNPVPVYFSKRVSEAANPGETIPFYQGLVTSLDYEAELAVILGKTIKNAAPEEARDAIFGYTILNDVSARDIQTAHKQWHRGKSLDKFCPMGPCIVTADEIGWPVELDIQSYVNGEQRQSSNTRLLIHGIAESLSTFSQGCTLLAGSILSTGTPAGVGMGMVPPQFLKPGDEVICRIEKIGDLVNTIGE